MQDKYIYAHKYEVGDVAIWDTQMTMHSATPIGAPNGPRHRTPPLADQRAGRSGRVRACRGRRMIDLHYWPTPNGKKVTILLEECGLPYNVVPCHIGRGDQFGEEFLRISPNKPDACDRRSRAGGRRRAGHRLRIRRDHDVPRREGRESSIPLDLRERHDVNQWVMWQMANQGPKTGELGHFRRLDDSAGDQSYALRRFDNEVNRLYGVLNNRLYDRPFIAGDQYTIADMVS